MSQDLIAFIVFAIVVAGLVLDDLRIRSKRRKLAEALLQQTLDKMALLNKIEKLSAQADTNSVEQTDGFLKFVSESRDWAFSYIEEVQGGLDTFKSKVDLDIKYILKYGQLIEHPLQESINRIAEAYEELQKLMPQNKDQV